jgi:predicted nucleic acid-binding protein
MPAEVHDASTYSFFSQDEILLDANIWLYLEGPPGQDQRLVEAYSGLLERILAKRNVLVTAPLVVSEFVNRYVRLHYDAWTHRREKSFKDFRLSAAYRPVLQGLDQACKTMLSLCSRTVRGSVSLDELEADVSNFVGGSHDFNDLILARLCRKDNLILVTHDADFAAIDGLTIVTANRRWFRS